MIKTLDLVCSAYNSFSFVFKDWERLLTVVKSSRLKFMNESESAFDVSLKNRSVSIEKK